MGYRVEYGPGEEKGAGSGRLFRVGVMTAFCFAAFLLLVGTFWPQGARALREILLPGDAAVTAAALEELTQELKAGQGLGQALEHFCRMIFQEAGLVH